LIIRLPFRSFIRLKFLNVAMLGFALIFFGCSQPQSAKETTAGVPPKDWPQKMQQLSKVLSDLLPFIASQKKFTDPANAEKIERDTTELKSLTHALKTGEMPNNDPSMKVVSQLFDDDLSRALASLKNGNRDYARRILSDTSSYCIQCHTQTNNGPEFPRLTLELQMKDLKPLDRAEFLTATRQFEPALAAYKQALSEPDLASTDAFAYETAAREALAISVRVHKDPKEALGLVKTIKKNRALPAPFKKTTAAWQKSLEQWKKERPKKLARNEDPSLHELNQAEALINAARSSGAAPLDSSQDIYYLRAGSLLHDLLQRPTHTDELSARALYLLGVASEATRDTNFWGMHETYYEQCIRLRPVTEQSRQCFGRLKDSVLMGYSGSAGTVVPPSIQKRLDSYELLAFGPAGDLRSKPPLAPGEPTKDSTPE
jgi:cytochrome c553